MSNSNSAKSIAINESGWSTTSSNVLAARVVKSSSSGDSSSVKVETKATVSTELMMRRIKRVHANS